MRILLKLKEHDLMVIEGDDIKHLMGNTQATNHIIARKSESREYDTVMEFSQDSFEYIVWDSRAIHHRIDISNRDDPNTCTLIPYFSRIKD